MNPGAEQQEELALLPRGVLESLALPGESYKLALTSRPAATCIGDKVIDPMLTGGRLRS